MIGTTFKEFYEQLYYGSDIEIVYKGENYIITSANCEDGRHLFVSKLVNSGVNICLVQKLANHKNISTTQHYFNYNQQMLANAVENVKI